MSDNKSQSTVRRDYRGTGGAIKDAEGGDRSAKPTRSKRHPSSNRRRGVSADQAKRTEHKGESGEKSYGTPMSTGAKERKKK